LQRTAMSTVDFIGSEKNFIKSTTATPKAQLQLQLARRT